MPIPESLIIPPGTIGEWPVITDEDRRSVAEVLEGENMHVLHGSAKGSKTDQFQRRLSSMTGVSHVLVTNGGTAALHMGLYSVGVERGDEVLTSVYSYWATPAAILHQGGTPVLVDIDPVTHNINPALIAERITGRTTVILPVHIHGLPCDMDMIRDIALRYDLKVVGDACQAFGATYGGKQVVGLGDVSGVSHNRSKGLMTGEGGALYTCSDEYAKNAQAMRSDGTGGEYVYTVVGYNYRPTELASALGLSQLANFRHNIETRRHLTRYLTLRLDEVPGFSGTANPPYIAESVCWRYFFHCDHRKLGVKLASGEWRKVCEIILRHCGVPAGQWQPITLARQPFLVEWAKQHGLCYDPGEYPVAESFIEEWSCLDGVRPPHDQSLMDKFLAVFEWISQNTGEAIDFWRKNCQ